MLLVDRARKDFGNVHAVAEVSFSIDDGMTFGLLGPNGAGKTTTMRMILGILTPDGGTITWNGAATDARTRRHFGYLPEERGLYGKMRVRDHIAYFGRLRGIGAREVAGRTTEWIERLALQEYADRPCAELSKGNQQKVQVACAAVHRPALLDSRRALLRARPGERRAAARGPRGVCKTTERRSYFRATRCGNSSGSAPISASSPQGGISPQERSPTCGGVGRHVACASAPGSAPVTHTLEGIDGTLAVERDDASVTFDLPPTTDFAALLRSLVAVDSIIAFEPIEPSLRDLYLNVIEKSIE